MVTAQDLLTEMTIEDLNAVDLSIFDADSAILVRQLRARREPTVIQRMQAQFLEYVSRAGHKYRARAAHRQTGDAMDSDVIDLTRPPAFSAYSRGRHGAWASAEEELE